MVGAKQNCFTDGGLKTEMIKNFQIGGAPNRIDQKGGGLKTELITMVQSSGAQERVPRSSFRNSFQFYKERNGTERVPFSNLRNVTERNEKFWPKNRFVL